MDLDINDSHKDGNLESRNEQKKNSFLENLHRYTRTFLMRTLALTLGLSAFAHMSPAMAQFSCESVYGVTRDTGAVFTINDDGSTELFHGFNMPGVNPFGISAGGIFSYTAAQDRIKSLGAEPGSVIIHNSATKELIGVTPPAKPREGMSQFVAGAVNPVNNWFYMAAANNAATYETTGWHIYGVNPEAINEEPIYVGLITETNGSSGDLAFDDLGNLFLISGYTGDANPENSIYIVGQVPTIENELPLPAKILVEFDSRPEERVNGIAFDAAGRLVTSNTGGLIQWFDPLVGKLLQFSNMQVGNVIDLASCAGGNTISIVKDLPNGRFIASDQFTLQLNSDVLSEPEITTTEGNSSGLQTAMIGPLLAIDAAEFTIDEIPVDGTNFNNYARSWECINQTYGNVVIASGTEFPGTVRMPAPSGEIGSGVLCTITNRLLPEVYLSKRARPASGTAVEAGDILTYTVAVEVVNGPTQTDFELTDTIGTGLQFNALGNISPFVPGATPGTFILPAGTNTGNYTLTYTATVTSEAANVVRNSIEGAGGRNPSSPAQTNPICATGACETQHPLELGVVLWKESTPVAGTKVVAGQELTYTINVDVVSSATQSDVTISDQIGPGLEYLGVVGNTTPFEVPSPSEPVFVLPAGTPNDEYSLSYRVRVLETAAISANNSVTAEGGGGPGSPNYSGPSCLIPGGCQTQHPIDPITTLRKTAAPEPGTFVTAGESVTYTLTVQVDKGPTQSPIVLTDTLGDGLTFNSVTVPGPFTYDATNNTFILPTGTASGTYSVSYIATVDEDSSLSVNNSVIGTGGGYPPDPINPTPTNPVCAIGACETTHPVSAETILSKDADLDSGAPVEPGDTITYTITLQVNNGPTISDIEITDTLSDNLTFDDVVGDISPFEKTQEEGVYILPAGTESGEYSFSYTVIVDANATGTVGNTVVGVGGGDPNGPNGGNPTCAPQACETEHPLKFAVLLSKDSDPEPGTKVKQEQVITYTLHVDVVYSPTQSPVVITDKLGDGLTYLGVGEGVDITPFVEGPDGTFTLPAGTPNDEYSVTYTAQVNADATVTVNNSVSGTGGDDPNNPTDPNYQGPQCDYDEGRVCATEHPVEPTVLLSKTADPESGTMVKPGDVLSYTVQVEVLNGPTQSDIFLVDYMDRGLTFGSVTNAGAFIYDAGADTFILPAGQATGTYPLTYTATVNENSSVAVNNSISGSGGGYPPDPINPTPTTPVCAIGACETTHPVSPSTTLNKDADPDSGTPVEPGDTLTYTITVQVNSGPTLRDIEITDTISDNLTFGDVVGDISPFDRTSQEGVYILPAGTESGEYSFSYTAIVDANATGTVGNTVVGVGGGDPDGPNGGNPTCAPQACETEHPIKFAVLLSKDSDPEPGTKVQQGDVITYTLHVDVVYSQTQSPVVVTDDLGKGLTYLGVGEGVDITPFVEDPPGTFTLPTGTPNDEYSVTYTAQVNADATVTVNNSVSATGGGDQTDPNAPEPICDYDEGLVCATEHPVEPTVLLSKTADPESGTVVKPDDVLTYTLQVDVLSGPTQSEVVLTDVLGEGLVFGELTDAGEFTYDSDTNTFTLPEGTANGTYEVRYTATVEEGGRLSVSNSVSGTGGGDPTDPNPTEPVCEPEACETTHPLAPTVAIPVPLGTWPWSAALIALLAGFGFWVGGRRRVHW